MTLKPVMEVDRLSHIESTAARFAEVKEEFIVMPAMPPAWFIDALTA